MNRCPSRCGRGDTGVPARAWGVAFRGLRTRSPIDGRSLRQLDAGMGRPGRKRSAGPKRGPKPLWIRRPIPSPTRRRTRPRNDSPLSPLGARSGRFAVRVDARGLWTVPAWERAPTPNAALLRRFAAPHRFSSRRAVREICCRYKRQQFGALGAGAGRFAAPSAPRCAGRPAAKEPNPRPASGAAAGQSLTITAS